MMSFDVVVPMAARYIQISRRHGERRAASSDGHDDRAEDYTRIIPPSQGFAEQSPAIIVNLSQLRSKDTGTRQ